MTENTRNTPQHTPGPWYSEGTRVYATTIPPIDADGTAHSAGTVSLGGVADCDMPARRGLGITHANAARIVACVNALEGLDPSAVGELLEAAREAKRTLDSIAVDHTVGEAPATRIKDIDATLGALRLAIRKCRGGAD